ncbi:MAG: hypothetical protein SFX72_10015 [Isosphaeraceae bacterium]|nr:hypothetical protein [Isosphaeraceae bacterium]
MLGDSTLETRVLLASSQKINVGGTVLLAPPQTAGAGSAVVVTTPSAQRFYIALEGPGNVRAIPVAGGSFRLIVEGTDVDSNLTINPVLQQRRHRKLAHTFSPGNSTRDGLVKIAGINVVSGRINSILGYRTAVLNGPVVVGDITPIDRIAFYSVKPGGSIATGGDVNTLDIFADGIFRNSPGIYVGRDLNYINVGGDLGLFNGANLQTGRDVGLVGQPVKGTQTGIGPSSTTTDVSVLQGGLIQGNFVIGTGSRFIVGRSLDAPFVVRGTVFGVTSSDTSRISIPNGTSNFVSLGGGVAFNG